MGKIVRMTSEEMDKEWTPEKLAELEKKKIRSFTFEEMGCKPGKTIARGLDQFQAYLKKNNIKTNKDFKEALIRDGLLSPDDKPTRKMKKQTTQKVHRTA